MLLQFRFNNFGCFKEKTILDFSATRNSALNSHVVQIGNEKILSSAMIIGTNASGKTTLIKAFQFMNDYVINSFLYGGQGIIQRISNKGPSLFEVYFINDTKDKNRQYKYGFTLDERGVCEEWLLRKAKTSKNDFKTIFYRNRKTNELKLEIIPRCVHDNVRNALQNETLIVSLGAVLKIEKLSMIRNWFLKNAFESEVYPFDKRTLLNCLNVMDPSIIDLDRQVVRHLRKDKSVLSVPINEEAAGIQKIVSIVPAMQKALKAGGVFVVDDLSDHLSLIRIKNILNSFLDPMLNKKKAQIIFSTHDISLKNMLRKDEVWCIKKEEDGSSGLKSMTHETDKFKPVQIKTNYKEESKEPEERPRLGFLIFDKTIGRKE